MIVTYSRKRKTPSSEVVLGVSRQIGPPEVKKPKTEGKKKKDAAPARTTTQLFLDVGQRGFVSEACPVCGLVFSRGAEDDERLHAAVHKRATQPVSLPRSWRAKCESLPPFLRVVSRSADSSGECVVLSASSSPDSAGSRTFKALRRALEEVWAMVDSALGFVECGEKLGSGAGVRLYVFVNGTDKAVGAVVAEPVEKAHRVILAQSQSDTSPSKRHSSLACHNETEPCGGCGVSRVWVHPRHRRHGIASRLLDVVRSDFVYGCTVPRELLAFSQPTPDGFAFFSRYTGRQDFLTYS